MTKNSMVASVAGYLDLLTPGFAVPGALPKDDRQDVPRRYREDVEGLYVALRAHHHYSQDQYPLRPAGFLLGSRNGLSKTFY